MSEQVGLSRVLATLAHAVLEETDAPAVMEHVVRTALGVERGQGYLWGTPTTPDAFATVVAARPT